MATTITPSTLTVQIKEEITLGGTSYDQTVNHTIADIGNMQKTVINLGANASHNIAQFATAPRNGEFDIDDLKYVRITNLDDTNEVMVNFVDASTETAAIQVEAGKSVVLFDTKVAGNSTGSTETVGTPIDNIVVHNPDASLTVDIEIVIATL